jgi:Uma2 family endonuclease
MLKAIKSARWTRHDLERFPEDGNRYEVLNGELLVTPEASFGHQIVATRLLFELGTYCKANPIGVVVGPASVRFAKNELQPDIEVLPPGAIRRRSKWEQVPLPILVVEVLSPFAVSRRRDLDIKRVAYLGLGIPEYWVVDHEKRRVHVWILGLHDEIVMTEVLRWQPVASAPALSIQLSEIFAFDEGDDD